MFKKLSVPVIGMFLILVVNAVFSETANEGRISRLRMYPAGSTFSMTNSVISEDYIVFTVDNNNISSDDQYWYKIIRSQVGSDAYDKMYSMLIYAIKNNTRVYVDYMNSNIPAESSASVKTVKWLCFTPLF